jgi:hypothetical protein
MIYYLQPSLPGWYTHPPKKVYQLRRIPILLWLNSKVNGKSFVLNISYITQIKYSHFSMFLISEPLHPVLFITIFTLFIIR